MRRIIFLGFLAVFICTINTAVEADLIDWDVISGSDVKQIDNGLEINSSWSRTQNQGFHGGGFKSNGPDISFSVDLWTRDSYSASRGYGGWYDAFFVNMNQDGFILDDKWLDPVTEPTYGGGTVTEKVNLVGSTFLWGGKDWGFCSLEKLVDNFTLSLSRDYNPSKDVYVSVGWKTNLDNLYSSGGSVEFANNVAPVPEPATLLLLGAGLTGLVGMRKRKKRDLWK